MGLSVRSSFSILILAGRVKVRKLEIRGMAALAPLVLASVLGCAPRPPPFRDPFTRPRIDWMPQPLLGTVEAGRILGKASRLEGATAYEEGGTKVYLSAFRDDLLDPRTGKTGILYYMLEEYQSGEAARSFLKSTKKENRQKPGADIRLPGGAEIHYLRGGEVIRMALILKGRQLVRLKVNQATSRYSLDQFMRVAEELASQLR
jgi:hypothetical protein